MFRAEGICDTVLRVGSGTCEEGGVSGIFLLIMFLPFGYWARGGRLIRRLFLCLILSTGRVTVSEVICQSSLVIRLGVLPHLLGLEPLLVGAIGTD